MRRRFFVESFEGMRAEVRGEAAHHPGRVLRAEPGQLYELSDGKQLWLGRVERVSKSAVEFALVEQLPTREPRPQTTLLLAIVKFDRFEWALEKATELGVSEIVPVAAARSEKALVAAAAKRAARWERILVEAAQQARRLKAPKLWAVERAMDLFGALCLRAPLGHQNSGQPTALSIPQEENKRQTQRAQRHGGHREERVPHPSTSLCTRAEPLLHEHRILLSERQGAAPLRQVLDERVSGAKALENRAESMSGLKLRTPKVVLAIGPEGGWAEEEFAAARAAGFEEASLGENILRTETAVVAALAAVNYALSG